MAYHLNMRKPVGIEIRRVVLEQIDKAIAEICDESANEPETIHQVRKRCKKIRAVLRLVRGSLADPEVYATENAHFRDAARRLSTLRDAEVLLETFDTLMHECADDIDPSQFSVLRQYLVRQQKQIAQDTDRLRGALTEFSHALTQARQRACHWQFHDEGFAALASGLKRTYRRGRHTMSAAYQNPSGEVFHEWRKRTKYHWYHCRLLRDVWKPVMKTRIGELNKLGKTLGDYHDLDVLQKRIASIPDDSIDGDARHDLLRIAAQYQDRIRAEIYPDGKKAFAEKPKHLKQRFKRYWKAGLPTRSS